MATIKFLLKGKNNPTKIYVRVKDGRNFDVMTATPFFANRNDWSTAKGGFKNLNDEVKKQVSSKLKNIENSIFIALQDAETIKDINWLKNILYPNQSKDDAKNNHDSINLIDWFNNYIEFKKHAITKSTIKKINVFKHLLLRFETDRKKPIIINGINQSFKTELENYCIKQGYANNTIARLFNYIKTICRYADTNGIATDKQLTALRGKFERALNVYLNNDEITQIQAVKLSGYLDNARDWLLISCYTGQRVSDFLRFTKDMLMDIEGKTFIHFTQTKTGKPITLPLHPIVIEILKKRNGDFPKPLSDQKYNQYIKEVGRLANLTHKVKGSKRNPKTNRKETGEFEKWELITSHIGRRSFATNNYGKIPTSLLKSATGHSTEQQFLEYIGKTDEEQAKQLAKYW